MTFAPRTFSFSLFVAAAFGMASSTCTSRAFADELGRPFPSDPDRPTESASTTESPRSYRVELSAGAAYTTAPIRGGTNPFGGGLALRAGLAFEHLYLGAVGRGYLGGSDVQISDRAFMGGAEIGYGFSVAGATFTFRPTVGVGGVMILHTDPSLAQQQSVDVVSSASGGGGGNSDTTTLTNLYLQPALTFMFSSGAFFGAFQMNGLILPGITYSSDTTTWLSYGLEASLGARF